LGRLLREPRASTNLPTKNRHVFGQSIGEEKHFPPLFRRRKKTEVRGGGFLDLFAKTTTYERNKSS